MLKSANLPVPSRLLSQRAKGGVFARHPRLIICIVLQVPRHPVVLDWLGK
tara:strand:- start:102 stop:251 length:150 start_codon:yes stop_codon:yes gene_type:complete